MRVNVYIDGFNLFYGLKLYERSGANYRWLDLGALCASLAGKRRVGRIRYFTARVDGRGDPQSPQNQDTYLRALGTTPNLSIHLGRFLSSTIRMPLANSPTTGPRTVEVIKTEEKGSDVNIATYLLLDCFREEFDMAFVISNDSDLIEPIRIVRQEFGCPVGVFNPQRRFSSALKQVATFYTKIDEERLRSSQFPDVVYDHAGELRRPDAWRGSLPDSQR